MLKYSRFFLFAAVSSFASVAYGVGDQTEKLQKTIEAALDILYPSEGEVAAVKAEPDTALAEKEAQVREIIESGYDLDVIIRRAIGRNWGQMDEAEQARVLDLIKQLVVRSYVRGMQGKTRPEIVFGRLTELTDRRIEIDSVVDLDGKRYAVVYRLGRMQSGWQIYDIVAENISVVSNFRQQIDDHFRRQDGQALIQRLEKLLESDDLTEDLTNELRI